MIDVNWDIFATFSRGSHAVLVDKMENKDFSIFWLNYNWFRLFLDCVVECLLGFPESFAFGYNLF